jgi:septum formation protein
MNSSSSPPLILASSSASRAALLHGAGLDFSIQAPSFDEDIAKTRWKQPQDGAGLAMHLAEGKALSVSMLQPEAWVIGADQILECEGRFYDKAADLDRARRSLQALRGRSHRLITATVLARGQEIVWRACETPVLEMRAFSDGFLDDYLAREGEAVLGSVGCYRIEALGVQLFASIEGDMFAIRGLPLLPLFEALRRFGLVSP